MANGLLGKTLTSNGIYVNVYAVPSSVQFATATISLVNMSSAPAKARVAITTADSPGSADFIEYDVDLPANGGVLERTCIVLSPNEKIMVYADNSNIAVRAFGLEQA